MQRSHVWVVCAVFVVFVAALAIVLFAVKTDDGFFKGDYFGVTWDMTPDEVFNAFTETKISWESDLKEKRQLQIEHLLYGHKVVSVFYFDSALRLGGVAFKLNTASEDINENTGTLADFVGKYTNQIVRKYGKASKTREAKYDSISYKTLIWGIQRYYIIVSANYFTTFEGYVQIGHGNADSEVSKIKDYDLERINELD